MDIIDEILDELTDRDISLYYLFHICKSPSLMAYKTFFNYEPLTDVSILIKTPLFYKSEIDDYVIMRYNRMCKTNPNRFLSIIKSEIDAQSNRLLPSRLNTNSTNNQTQSNISLTKTDTTSPHYSIIENGVLVKFDERDLDENGCYTTPKSVKVIGEVSFEYCKNLKHITLSSGVTHIEDGAFACCLNLESIKLPSSLKSIGDIAFMLCKNLKTLTIPSKVTTLGYMTFSACLNLDTITLHENIKKIGSSAFYLTDTKPVNLPEKFKQDWNSKKFKRGLSRSFSGILDAIRKRNNLTPLNLVLKY